jgi:hypothetical protein
VRSSVKTSNCLTLPCVSSMRLCRTSGLSAGMVLVACVLLFRQALADDCFAPLSNVKSRNVDDWQDLAQFDPTKRPLFKKTEGVKQFLPLSDKPTPLINIDFYFVNFTPPPNISMAALFKTLRGKFGEFASGTDGKFGFGPYKSSNDANDALGKKNATTWQSGSPEGALMSFNFDANAANAFVRKSLTMIKEVHGDLQVTCASPIQFIFSTVESERGKIHPVAGRRGFGLKDNSDGTWMFYSKATDTESASPWNFPTHLWKQPSVFCLGHQFWLRFYPNMKASLEAMGATNVVFNSDNHGTVKYPFDKTAPVPVQEACSK